MLSLSLGALLPPHCRPAGAFSSLPGNHWNQIQVLIIIHLPTDSPLVSEPALPLARSAFPRPPRHTSELRNASKGDLREGILKILKNILGPKIDWSRITACVQRKEETVSEYTERFCQSAVIYSGIVDDPEGVLDDKGPLVRIWSDGLVAEYRKALPFLDLTWSNRTLRSNLDRLATWERDADVKAKVRVAAATFNTTKQDNRWSKRESKCKYCEKFGHWEKECRKKLQDSKRNAMHNSAPSQPAHNPEVVPPVTTETIGQLVQALLRAQQDQEKN